MKAVIISLDLFKQTGGPTKTIGSFKRALDAKLYAFCKWGSLQKDEFAIPDARPIISSQLPVLAQFRYANEKQAKKAELALKESGLISCHGFYRYHPLWVHSMSKKHKIPYWFVPHGILDPWVMESRSLIKQLYWKFGGNRFLQESSTVIFSTKLERDKAAGQFDLPDAAVVPWPVELIDLSNREEIRKRIRRELKIPMEVHVLLYFGRLHRMKRPLETIEAFSRADTSMAHLIIVGNEVGITKRDCVQMASKFGLEKRMHFIGPVYGNAKYDYMHAADAYISLSYRENFNHTAAESLSAGLPVILSQGNDLRGELSDIKCFLEVEDNSMESMVAAINNFVSLSQQSLHDRGLVGREWVEKNLNFDLFKMRLLKLHNKYKKRVI